MIQAKGPVWHQKQKKKNIIPKGLTGVDKEATWSKSNADGWVYGHGAFSLVSHDVSVLGCFVWMPNSAHEAKRMWTETEGCTGIINTLVMDSKADDCRLSRDFKTERNITLVTHCRKNMDKTPERRAFIQASSPCKAWSKIFSSSTDAGCAAMRTTDGFLQPWGLPCRCINFKRIVNENQHGLSNPRCWGVAKNSPTPYLFSS